MSNGWGILLVRDLRADMRQAIQVLRADTRPQHQEGLTVLQGHTHADDGTADFHQLNARAD